MRTFTRKEGIYLVIAAMGLISLAFLLATHYMEGEIYIFLYERVALVAAAVVTGTGLIMFAIERFNLHKRKEVLSRDVNLLKVIFVTLSLVALSFLGGYIYAFHIYKPEGENWSIGIYTSTSHEPLYFTGTNIDNPVLTKDDITDVEAEFVADPFLIYHDNSFHLFFEVLNSKTQKGEIGLATSSDGFNWAYKGIILSNSYHLSYPCVFMWNNVYYMVENHGLDKVVLYKAHNFPYKWDYVKILLTGMDFHEPTIFQYDDTWWLFAQTRIYDTLRLYYSDTPLGPWIEHPESPVIDDDANIARPGGCVVVFDNRIIRYAQDDEPYYGNQVWALEITELSRENYEEQVVGEKPVLKGYDNWNSRGMHHISPCRISEDFWIASVDGK